MNTHNIIYSVSKIDSLAITLFIIGLVVVFLALTLLVIIFNNIPRIGVFFTRLRKGKITSEEKINPVPAQVSAAIAAAIYLYLDDIHDKDSRIMTIRRVSKNYSPWSSKIYGLNILRK